MPHEQSISVSGDIRDVFAHRFVVQTSTGPVLADLGPGAAKGLSLKSGDTVELTGNQKPSEIKITRLVLNGTDVAIETDPDEDPVDPQPALEAVRRIGAVVAAEPREKRKHFEILAKDADGRHLEYHVKHDGEVKKSKPGDPADPKWIPLRGVDG